MDPTAVAHRLKQKAWALGFDLVGICPAVTPQGIHHFYRWLDAGYGGQMQYLHERRDAYAHPSSVLPGVRTLVMLARNYHSVSRAPGETLTGQVSRYAWGTRDYHDLIHRRLKELKHQLQQWVPGVQARGVIDTAPLLEREFAQLAGLGWIAKNTMLINRSLGSWFFLAALLTDVALPPDDPVNDDFCGTCTACLDICPTDAFPTPYQLDATRCISYLTIELRDEIPASLRPAMGDWVFGCDLCQEVCPWNGRTPTTIDGEFAPRADLRPMRLPELFFLSDDQFRQLFRSTPLWRPRRRGILRNAAIALGNQKSVEALPALGRGLNDPEPVVQEACAWALAQIRSAT